MHPSHVTRFSDSSLYDYVCVNCGAHDSTQGWEQLEQPCPKVPVSSPAEVNEPGAPGGL
jgi:hypothetical protein